MITLIAVAFVMAFLPATQAMSLEPVEHPDAMITQVREACAGMHCAKWCLREYSCPPCRPQVRAGVTC
jgi:hypothetical protein